MSDNIAMRFPVTLYGDLERFSETISKCRCRIFYKYGNRNGTYITDEFAEKLLATVPYAPVKGIYEDDDEDFTDHGEERTEGRIYGLVPANPHLSWENHVDDDGIERTYACVDVLLYTALYKEAGEIIGKGQSMELYPKSIKGDWKIIEGQRYYVFEEACFLGLQALGDEVEPCFEGAAFFSMYNDLKKLVTQIEKYNLNFDKGGKKKMLNYKLSDGAKHNALWSLLNINYTEENNWVIDCDVCEVYDDYAVVRNYTDNCWERVYYSKNDETDSLEITTRERCYIMDISESEKDALSALRTLNGNTYEKVDENYSTANNTISELNGQVENLNTQIENLNTQNSDFSTKINELNENVSTLSTERDNAISELTEAQTSLATLNEEVDALKTFKADVEKNEKEGIINQYAELLQAEVLDTYSAKLDEFTATDLKKELAYELVSSKPAVFSKEPQTAYVPKGNECVGGIEEILSKYKK